MVEGVAGSACQGGIESQDCPVMYIFKNYRCMGFPGGAVVESPPASAGDTGSSPGLGGSHMPRSN